MGSMFEAVLALMASARKDVLLVAPFIKAEAMRRVLGAIPQQVSRIRCVTRWRAEEIAAGVSDLEVLDLLQERKGASLYVHPYLHAKYYRGDGTVLIGSANLTLRALGWSTPPNLELLFEADSNLAVFQNFERQLESSMIVADQSYREMVADAVAALVQKGQAFISVEMPHQEAGGGLLAESWLPLCSRPDQLYRIYGNIGVEQVVDWTVEAGQRDLQALQIPIGASSAVFAGLVVAALWQMPVVQRVMEWAAEPISPSKGGGLLSEAIGRENMVYSPEMHWETLKAWLFHFMPTVFRHPVGSADLVRGRVVG